MSGASAFFILIPAMYLLFALALGVIALMDRRLVAARWASLGFAVALVSILVDGYREPGGDRWISWFTVSTHFLPLLIMVQAFLARHASAVPRTAVAFLAFASIYVMPDMPWAPPHWFRGVFVQAACATLIASGLPRLWRFRIVSRVDILAFSAVLLAAISYAARSVVIYLNPIGETRADVLAFYDGLNLVFHSASALLGMCVGMVLMISVGFDIMLGRMREGEIDALTEVGNRRRLNKRIDEDIAGRKPIGAVIVIDLDHFKRINDMLGHDAGDKVLRAVAGRLKTLFADVGCVCRTGGEEFVVLLDSRHADAVSVLALAARQAIAKLTFEAPLNQTRVTASVGYHSRAKGQDVRSAIRRADQAVYCAKNDGRNRVVGAVDESGLHVLRAIAPSDAASAAQGTVARKSA